MLVIFFPREEKLKHGVGPFINSHTDYYLLFVYSRSSQILRRSCASTRRNGRHDAQRRLESLDGLVCSFKYASTIGSISRPLSSQVVGRSYYSLPTFMGGWPNSYCCAWCRWTNAACALDYCKRQTINHSWVSINLTTLVLHLKINQFKPSPTLEEFGHHVTSRLQRARQTAGLTSQTVPQHSMTKTLEVPWPTIEELRWYRL